MVFKLHLEYSLKFGLPDFIRSDLSESVVGTWKCVFYNSSDLWTSQVSLLVKNPPPEARDTRDVVSIPGSRRSPAIGNGSPLHCSCLENFRGQRSLAGYNPWGCRVRHGWVTNTHSLNAVLTLHYLQFAWDSMRVFKKYMGLKDPGFESWHWHGLDL